MNILFFSYQDEIFKIDNFYETIAPHMVPAQFWRWFRMERSTFEELAAILKFDENENLVRCKPIEFNKRLAMTLSFLGTQMPSFQ